jgi:hypothetical protein
MRLLAHYHLQGVSAAWATLVAGETGAQRVDNQSWEF